MSKDTAYTLILFLLMLAIFVVLSGFDVLVDAVFGSYGLAVTIWTICDDRREKKLEDF